MLSVPVMYGCPIREAILLPLARNSGACTGNWVAAKGFCSNKTLKHASPYVILKGCDLEHGCLPAFKVSGCRTNLFFPTVLGGKVLHARMQAWLSRTL